MHEVFSSRMETTHTCFTKTLLFTVWNGQVNCTCFFSPIVWQYFFYQRQGYEHDAREPGFPLLPVPAGVWAVHVGDHRGADQPPDCHDVRHLPEDPGKKTVVCDLNYYEIFQQQSDVEWKFGLAKLIRSMHRTDMSPSPINLVTTWLVYLFRVCRRGRGMNKCSMQ